MQEPAYDAIVVGSGISGGWAAKELTEKGLRVLLLERGRNIEHVKDYVNATKGQWEYPHRGGRTQEMIKHYPVLKRDYPLNEKNLDYWVKDEESPYTEAKRFDWYRGYHVGGRSLMWGRQSYRHGDIDFEANLKEGVAIDWPIRYNEIAPWYDKVEKFAGIAGNRDGLDVLPDGQFMPPHKLNCGEELVAGKLKTLFDGKRHLIHARVANITQALPGRAACQSRDACWLGCPYGAYFSTQSSTLPAAMATGKLTLKPFSIVSEVLYDKDKKRASGVRVLDAVTNETTDYSAKVIFLCASTLTRAELDDVLCWLTGYTRRSLAAQIKKKSDLEAFFRDAPGLHPNTRLITGVVCGVRVEEIKHPLMRKIRYMDKLVDELAKGRPMEKILRAS